MDGLLDEYPNSTVYWERTVAGDGGGFRICRKAWTSAQPQAYRSMAAANVCR